MINHKMWGEFFNNKLCHSPNSFMNSRGNQKVLDRLRVLKIQAMTNLMLARINFLLSTRVDRLRP